MGAARNRYIFRFAILRLYAQDCNTAMGDPWTKWLTTARRMTFSSRFTPNSPFGLTQLGFMLSSFHSYPIPAVRHPIRQSHKSSIVFIYPLILVNFLAMISQLGNGLVCSPLFSNTSVTHINCRFSVHSSVMSSWGRRRMTRTIVT